MAEPSDSSQPLLVPLTAPTWLERLEIWLEQLFVTIGLLYSRHYLLTAQLLLSFAAAAFCGFQTRNETGEFKAASWTTLFIGIIYLCLMGMLSLVMKVMKNWFRGRIAKYWVVYYGLRAFGIGGLLKVCIFLSDLLGSQKNLDGYVTGFFLFSYLHVVSFTKLLKIQDEVCLSDSLMAMALLIATRLDSKENLLRSIASYGSAYALICFRYSTVPYEKEAQDISTTTHSSEMVVIDMPNTSDDATAENVEEAEASNTPAIAENVEEAEASNTLAIAENVEEAEASNTPAIAENVEEAEASNTPAIAENVEEAEASNTPAIAEASNTPAIAENVEEAEASNTPAIAENVEEAEASNTPAIAEASNTPAIAENVEEAEASNTPAIAENVEEAEASNTLAIAENVEEAEASNTQAITQAKKDRQLDSSRVQPAMASIAASREADLNAERLREKEDVDIIANELELGKDVVKKVLREHKGDAVAATRYMLNRLEEFRRLG